MTSPLFSVIIPCRVETAYLQETLACLRHQTFTGFEVIVVTDKQSATPSPAVKRNFGAARARGKFLAFIDDDSYPDFNWLSSAERILSADSSLTAVCGPCLTPPADNIFQQASGLVWSSFMGSGGAGTYRNTVSHPRYVDDYPSVNLIVNRRDFLTVKGFNTHHWPGEDTILCLDLTSKLGKKIYYHPSIIVYHHRRSVIIPHLQQITRYALHRGNFARIYPKTSFRIGYLIPSLFLLYCLFLPFFLTHNSYLAAPLLVYLLLLFFTFLKFVICNSNFVISALAVAAIPLTHLYYGALFIIGYFTPKLSFKAHKVDSAGTTYLGG